MDGTVWVVGSWAANSWANGSWLAVAPATLGDFTTLLVNRLETIYAATPDDYSTLFAAEYDRIRDHQLALNEDWNTDAAIVLS